MARKQLVLNGEVYEGYELSEVPNKEDKRVFVVTTTSNVMSTISYINLDCINGGDPESYDSDLTSVIHLCNSLLTKPLAIGRPEYDD